PPPRAIPSLPTRRSSDLTLVVLVIVALVGAAVFLLTFDPNAYKNKVEQLVYERYQRHLTIEGDIELSLFPRIGLAVEHVSLSNQDRKSTRLNSSHVKTSY